LMRSRSNILIALAVVACIAMPVGGLCLESQDSARDSISESEEFTIAEKEWAVYLYCGGDNDQEEVVEFAIDQSVRGLVDAAVDGTGIHVIALMDRISVPGTWIYELTRGGKKPAYNWLEDERNTSDPAS